MEIPTKSIFEVEASNDAVSHHHHHLSIVNPDKREKSWVTCFGFPPGLSEAIVTHFVMVKGLAVVDYSPKKDAKSNWVHLKLQSQKDVAVALGESNKVIDINELKVMLGVKLFPEGDQLENSLADANSRAHTSKPGKGGVDAPQRASSVWERMAVWVMDL